MLQPPLRSPGARLRELFREGTVAMPGAYDAFTARLAYKAGAKAGYLSGGAMTNALLGAPDIGLATLDEFVFVAERACAAAPIPLVMDADTGFGEVQNVRRTVLAYERAGLAGLHLEDQVNPKRCGHLEGKELIPAEAMAEKVRAAVEAKADPSFLVIARTDARGVTGLEDAVERAKAYRQAGADAVFPEGLRSEEEFERFRAEVEGPLLANMTEFGKTPLIPVSRFAELGYQMVIFPVSALRVAHRAVEELYKEVLETGTQQGQIDKMRTRKELYDALDYDAYLDEENSISDLGL